MENENMLILTLYHLTTNALLIFNKKDINLIIENILLFYKALYIIYTSIMLYDSAIFAINNTYLYSNSKNYISPSI